MAQRIEVVLIDDLDGGPAEETVTFALDGVTYEIDLNAKNAGALRDQFASWTGNARRISGGRGGRRRGGAGASAGARRDLSAVREWARSQGMKVSDRGRVPAAVLEAYDAAH